MAETVKIMVVAGVEGPSIYINDFRVAGPKPWGGGPATHTFTAKVSDIEKAIGFKWPKPT